MIGEMELALGEEAVGFHTRLLPSVEAAPDPNATCAPLWHPLLSSDRARRTTPIAQNLTSCPTMGLILCEIDQ